MEIYENVTMVMNSSVSSRTSGPMTFDSKGRYLYFMDGTIRKVLDITTRSVFNSL